MIGWLGALKLLLSLALSIADTIRERRLMDAGEAKATAKSLVALANRLQLGNELLLEIEAMTDDEIDDALRGDRG